MKKSEYKQVYQFKITLRESLPPIWRRVQVPETYSFWDLHVAIADAMGWLDYHLHEFEMPDPKTGKAIRIGIPDDEFDEDREILPDRKQKISRYFSIGNRFARYEYDFGDGWEHDIKLEDILPREEGVDYPVCVSGNRACPPEDCGGIWGYAHLLEVLSDPEDEEHHEMLEWVGGAFDPEHFDPAEIWFDDPDKRWKLANEFLEEEKE